MNIFNIYKVSEGGMGQKLAIELLKDAGIIAKPCISRYVGQTAVSVKTNSVRKLEKIARILYHN